MKHYMLVVCTLLALCVACAAVWPPEGGYEDQLATEPTEILKYKKHKYWHDDYKGYEDTHHNYKGSDSEEEEHPSKHYGPHDTCQAHKAGVTVSGPANNIEVPTLCTVNPTCPTAACPNTQYLRYGVEQVTDHFQNQPSFAMVDGRHHSYSCVDARGEEPMLGTPGGDLAEVMAAALALLKLRGLEYNADVVEEVFNTFIERVASPERPLYLHTDDSRLRSMFVYLQDKLEPKEQPNILPFQGPSDANGEKWIEALKRSEFNGCGHIRLMISDQFNKYYSVSLTTAEVKDCTGGGRCIDSKPVGQQIIEDFFRYWWFTKPGSPQRYKVAFQVDGILLGPLVGKAVTIVSKDPKAACNHQAPLVRPNFGASQVFVYHGDAVADWRAYVAEHNLADLIHKAGGSTADFLDLWNKIAGQQLGATLTYLAPANNVGIFNVNVPVEQVEGSGYDEKY